MKHGQSVSLSGRTATMLRYGTSTLRRNLFAVIYALAVSLFVVRSILVREGIFHMSDLTYLASREQFPGFSMWDPLTQDQVIINHLVFDPWLAFFEPAIAQRVYLLVLFFLLPFLSFVGFRGLLDRHFDRYVTVSALVGSLLYTFNPIVVIRSRHYFLVWFYAFLPVLFYYTVKLSADLSSIDSDESAHSMIANDSSTDRGPDTTWVKIAFVLFLMSASVRMPFYFLVPLFAVVAFISYPYGRYLWRQTKRWTAIFGLYFLLTAIWSFPYLMRTVFGSGPTPAGNRYVVTEQVLFLLSRSAYLENVLFLRSFWGNNLMGRIFGITSPSAIGTWELAVALIVGLAFFGALLYLRDKRDVLALSALLVLSIFLTKGTNPPFPDFYSWLVFESPLSGIGWQFRGSTKWNLLVMFAYAGLAAFSISWLFRTAASVVGDSGPGAKREVAAVAVVGLALVVAIAIAAGPMTSGQIANDAQYETKPPNYESLLNESDEYKVHSYPRAPPTGTPGKRGTARSQYYQYAMTERANTEQYLAHANVGYVYESKFARGVGGEPDSVRTIADPREMITAEARSTYSFSFPYLRQQPTVYGTASIDEGTERSLRRSDVVVVNDRPPVPFLTRATVVSPMAHTSSGNPTTDWAKASTDDPGHGRWHFYLDRYGIWNWQFDYDSGLVHTTGTKTLEDAPDPADVEPVERWDFDEEAEFDAWNRSTQPRQSGARQELSRSDEQLIAELHNATSGWKEVRSPAIPIESRGMYNLRLRIRGTDTQQVHLKVSELDDEGRAVRTEQVGTVGDGTFDWRTVEADYVVRNESAVALRVEVWHGSNTDRPLPNTVRIDDLQVRNLTAYTEPVSLRMPVSVEETTEYKLFVRHFESQNGGEMSVSLDDDVVQIPTEGTEDGFVWTDLGTHRLEAGEHEIRLANEEGFNAVNLFVLVPVSEYRDQNAQLERLLRNKTSVYAYEAERGFEASGDSSQVPPWVATTDGEVLLSEDDALRQEIRIDRAGEYTLSARGAGAFEVHLSRIGDIDGESPDVQSAIYQGAADEGRESEESFDEADFTFRESETTTESLGSVSLEPGRYTLEIVDTSPGSVDVNQTVAVHDFESDVELERVTSNFSVRHSDTASGGDSSLAVTTSTTDQQWSWVTTKSTSVTPGQRYEVHADMRHQNVVRSHALLYGYNERTEEWERLRSVFESTNGTDGWETETTVFEMPRDITRVRFSLNGGWVEDPAEGNATTWFDEISVTRIDSDRVDAVWLSSGPEEGSVDPLAASDDDAATVERVEKLSPTEYRVRVDASQPYLLSFAEGYDPLWVAETETPQGTEQYSAVPLYATTNGFWIDETGTHTVTIRYRPQQWFYQGAAITGVTLVAALAYLFYGWRRRRGDMWAERVSHRVHQRRRAARRVFPWR